LIGAPHTGLLNLGAAYVFVRSGANWIEQQKLSSNDGVNGDQFGAAVALDGDTALLGAPYAKINNEEERGSAYVFGRVGATWSQQQKFTATDGHPHDFFGAAVGLSGNLAVIGSNFAGSAHSAAYVFARSGAAWTRQQKLPFGNAPHNDLGGLALKNQTLVTGARGSFSNGRAFVFDAPNSPPAITPFLNVNRTSGSTSTTALIASVSDAEDSAVALQVTVNGGASSQVGAVTLSNLSVGASGNVTATIQTFCTPVLTSLFALRVTDSKGAFTETTLTVDVTPNTAPVLNYAGWQSVSTGGATVINPASGLSDNGAISTVVVQSVTPAFSGSISVNSSGVVSVSNAGPSGSYAVTIRATDNCGSATNSGFTLNVGNGGGGSATNLQFYPLAAPVRLLDTRAGAVGCDAPGAMIAGGTSRTQTAAGRTCDGLTIPANARALTGNITTVQSGGGFLTLYPSDVAKPLAANSNYSANQVLNNVFTVGLGANDGAFKIFVTSNTNIVVDVTGYYAPPEAGGLYFHPLPKPIRLLETRQGQTGCFTPGAPLQAGTNTLQLGQTSCDGVTVPAGAQALVGNATTVGPQSSGYLTLYPADAAQPLVASSNFLTGDVMNAPFTVGLSPSGQFNVFTTSTTDLVIDVLGYYSTQLNDSNGQGLLFNSLPTPVRLLDTRLGQSACFSPDTPMTGSGVYIQSAVGACMNIPATAKAVVGNATVVNANTGYLTFWPSNAAQPLIATSNFLTGQVFNRHFTVGLGAGGAFKRFSSSTTDLVIDLSGYFAP
ncbi:MAG: FG-GAP repeat protein, partial [Acidobacteriota bacterium]